MWAQVETAAHDVEAFAAHAGRTVVGTEDVMLLARRNEVLEQLMRGRLAAVRAEHERLQAAQTTGRASVSARGRGKGKGKAG